MHSPRSRDEVLRRWVNSEPVGLRLSLERVTRPRSAVAALAALVLVLALAPSASSNVRVTATDRDCADFSQSGVRTELLPGSRRAF